ncbi:hypothetical protein [Jeotgalibacillus marinus]|uniref:Holin n=1 Tax=Jeotgalibacillus marinus TaxID=86667 RepID=A0ABV3Q110_9BACL
MNFPTIYTNIWDVFLAVPLIIITVQTLKIMLKIPKTYVPSLATVLGLFISMLISHRGEITAGIFMGFFYGGAAVGTYSSIKTTIISFLNKRNIN